MVLSFHLCSYGSVDCSKCAFVMVSEVEVYGSQHIKWYKLAPIWVSCIVSVPRDILGHSAH